MKKPSKINSFISIITLLVMTFSNFQPVVSMASLKPETIQKPDKSKRIPDVLVLSLKPNILLEDDAGGKANHKFKTNSTALDQVLSSLGIHSIKPLFPRGQVKKDASNPELERIYQVKLKPNTDIDAAIVALSSAADIEFAESDFYIDSSQDPTPTDAPAAEAVNDSRYPEQWALTAIGAPSAWAQIPTDAPKVTVAVVDSGVCADHPDLAGRILDGWDFVENDAAPQDEFGHGCSVTGIIAANMNNGIGIAGVAPNAQVMPLRVLDASGTGSYSNVASAIVYAADHDAKVINLSLGGSNPSATLESAVNYAISKGVIVVAAAGNIGIEGAMYPAAYPDVIAVGSVDSNLQHSSFSNYGSQIDIWAPGRDILTTSFDDSYTLVSGTSFAAPYVAGAEALLSLSNTPLEGNFLSFTNSSNKTPSTTLSETEQNTPTATPFQTAETSALQNDPYGYIITPTSGGMLTTDETGKITIAAMAGSESGHNVLVSFWAFYNNEWHHIGDGLTGASFDIYKTYSIDWYPGCIPAQQIKLHISVKDYVTGNSYVDPDTTIQSDSYECTFIAQNMYFYRGGAADVAIVDTANPGDKTQRNPRIKLQVIEGGYSGINDFPINRQLIKDMVVPVVSFDGKTKPYIAINGTSFDTPDGKDYAKNHVASIGKDISILTINGIAKAYNSYSEDRYFYRFYNGDNNLIPTANITLQPSRTSTAPDSINGFAIGYSSAILDLSVDKLNPTNGAYSPNTDGIGGDDYLTVIGVSSDGSKTYFARVPHCHLAEECNIRLNVQEAALLLIKLGATKAFRLDGGGSTQMSVQGQSFSYDRVQGREVPNGIIAYLDPNPWGDITSPYSNTILEPDSKGFINIAADANDGGSGTGVKKVSFWAKHDNQWNFIGEDTTAPYGFRWYPGCISPRDIQIGIHVENNDGSYYIEPESMTTLVHVDDRVCTDARIPLAIPVRPTLDTWHVSQGYNTVYHGGNGDFEPTSPTYKTYLTDVSDLMTLDITEKKIKSSDSIGIDVVAAADGTILTKDTCYLVVKQNGYSNVYTTYLHVWVETLKKQGDYIRKGEFIGRLAAMNGSVAPSDNNPGWDAKCGTSDGSHLHFMLNKWIAASPAEPALGSFPNNAANWAPLPFMNLGGQSYPYTYSDKMEPTQEPIAPNQHYHDLISLPACNPSTQSFCDVFQTSQFFTYVEAMKKLRTPPVTDGCRHYDPDNNSSTSNTLDYFCPEEYLKRGHAMKFLGRAFGIKEPSGPWVTPPYPDISSDVNDLEKYTQFYNWIMYLSDEGVVNGYTDGNFYPDNFVTRAQWAKMIARIFQNFGNPMVMCSRDSSTHAAFEAQITDVGTWSTLQNLPDDNKQKDIYNNAWCLWEIMKANGTKENGGLNANGLPNIGDPSTKTFTPDANITRAQSSKWLYFAMKMIPAKPQLSESTSNSSSNTTDIVTPTNPSTATNSVQAYSTTTANEVFLVTPGDDWDWVKINITTLDPVTFTTAENGLNADIKLEIYDSNATTLLKSSVGYAKDGGTTMTWTPAHTGTFYLKATNVFTYALEGSDYILRAENNGNTACASPNTTFCDVPVNHPRYAAIETAYQKGWFAGTTAVIDGVTRRFFNPSDELQRQHGVLVVSRWMYGHNSSNYASILPPVTGNIFPEIGPDLSGGGETTRAVEMGFREGITTPHSDGTFKPIDSATRKEFVYFVMRALLKHTTVTSAVCTFSDTTDLMIRKACDLGLIKGENGAFSPDVPLTRELAALIMCRAFSATNSGSPNECGETVTVSSELLNLRANARQLRTSSYVCFTAPLIASGKIAGVSITTEGTLLNYQYGTNSYKTGCSGITSSGTSTYTYAVSSTAYQCGAGSVAMSSTPDNASNPPRIKFQIAKCDSTAFVSGGNYEIRMDTNGDGIVNTSDPIIKSGSYGSGGTSFSTYYSPVGSTYYGPHYFMATLYSSNDPSTPKYTGTGMAWEVYQAPSISHNQGYLSNLDTYTCGNYIKGKLSPSSSLQSLAAFIGLCNGSTFTQGGKAYIYVDGVPRWGPFSYSSNVTEYPLGDIDPVSLGITGQHTYKIYAYSNDQPTNPNKYSGSITISDFEIPATSQNVQASDSIYTDQILVSWDDTAYSYQVWRAPTSSSGAASNISGTITNSVYADRTAVTGTTYYYWVKACLSNGACGPLSSYNTGSRKPLASVPANDNFNNATVISSASFNTSVSVADATSDFDDPTFTCVTGKKYNTVWYKFVPSASGYLTVDTAGSGYDTVVGLWSGTRGALKSLACNDNNGNTSSKINTYVTAGITYYIEVAGYSASNINTLSLSVGFNAPPVVTKIESQSPNPTGADSVNFQITMSESVTGVDATDFQTYGMNGAYVTDVTGSGSVYTVAVNTGIGQGNLRLNVINNGSIIDGGSLTLTGIDPDNEYFPNGAVYSMDKVVPTVFMSSTAADLTNTAPITVSVAFSENVTGFSAPDLVVNNGAISNFTGSGKNYSFQITPTTNGVITVDIPEGSAQDSVGNNNTAAMQFNRTYDTIAPTVSISSAIPNPTNAVLIPVTATFNEDVTGLTSDDIIAGNATISNFSGSGDIYNFDLTPTANGLVTVNIVAGKAKDLAGNNNVAATQFSRTYDNLKPTVSMSSSVANLTKHSPIAVSVTFSENVDNFIADDVTPSNATVDNFAGSGKNYTFDLMPLASGLVTAGITEGVAQDSAGNNNTASTQFSRIYDVTLPTVDTFTAQAYTTNLKIPVTAFTASDNGTVAGYMITTTPTPPAANDANWLRVAPKYYLVAHAGDHSLYPWVKDTAGNVSAVITPLNVTVTAFMSYSYGPNDGWALESSENSNTANTKSNTGNLRVGDDAKNRQYRSLLYFDTAPIPNNVVITKALVQVVQKEIIASPPNTIASLGNLTADMKKGPFGNAALLELADFSALAAPINTAGKFSSDGNGVYILTLSPANFKYINLLGETQFRMRFSKDDDNDKLADYISFYSGNDPDPNNQPQLIVEYYVP